MLFNKNKKFKKVVTTWLLFKKFSIKKTTFYRYQYIVNKYILSYFKDKRLYYFVNYDFNIYISYLSKNLSKKTVSDILTVLKGILKYIEKKYNYDYKLELISMPRYNQTEIKTMENSEMERLKTHCLNSLDYKEIGIAICLLTGMRIGEICALKWENIDLDNKLIYIKVNMQRVYIGKKKTKIVEDTPKTKKSIRKIPISNKLLEVLKQIYIDNKFSEDDYFLTGNKKYIEPRYYQKIFKECLNVCKIKNYNFHILRHSFATNCIKMGMDVKSLSEILGHSDVKITLNKYVHSSFDIQKKYLDKL